MTPTDSIEWLVTAAVSGVFVGLVAVMFSVLTR
jgi:hypothetical protein